MKGVARPAGLRARRVRRFCDQCAWAHEAWVTHRTLFDDNPNLRLIKDRGGYDAFFGRLRIITHEYVLLQIARLHDPATHGKRDNLTVKATLQLQWSRPVHEQLLALEGQLEAFVHKIRNARNRSIAHIDRETAMRRKVLGKFGRGLDVKYFKALQQFATITHEAATGVPYPFGDFARVDANFLKCLSLD